MYVKVIELTSNQRTKVEITNDDGTIKEKLLDYYEIPVEIESDYKKEIFGYINLAHIRTISKKRLDKSHVAIITEKTNTHIIKSLNKLLDSII